MIRLIPYADPVQIYLEPDDRRRHRYCYYLPIKESLQALIKHDSVVQQNHTACMRHEQTDVMEDITDGDVLKNNAFFQSSPSPVKLLLYTDAFKVANPLGSGSKKHKVHAVYYILGDLEVYNRSNIDQIQLVLLCREVDLKNLACKKSIGN
jgi:hypothetical protein